MLSCEIGKIYKNNYVEEHLRMTLSDLSQLPMQQITSDQNNLINTMILFGSSNYDDATNATIILSSDCNGIRNHNHLVHKRTLSHLGKLACLAKLASFASQKSQFG